MKNVNHHNLFFDTDFDLHATEIYDDPKWPTAPLFYANFTSLTDSNSAPKGKENGFFLIPLATDLEDSDELRAKYFNLIIHRFEKITHQEIKNSIKPPTIVPKITIFPDSKGEINNKWTV